MNLYRMDDIMKRVNEWICSHIETIIAWFLLLGPIFDCMTALSIHLLHIQFTGIIVIKILFLGLLLYDLFFISKCRYKKPIIAVTCAIIIYMIVFVVQTIVQKNTDVFFYECQSMVRTFFFPLTLLALYNLHLEKRLTIHSKYLCSILLFYLALILLPLLTHTGFDSYAYSKTGTIGWFYSTNEIGGILSILFPFLFCFLIKQKKWILFVGMVILMSVYFAIGTKVPILSVLITLVIFGIAYLIQMIQKHKWKQLSYLGIVVVIGIISLILIVPKTSFYKNIKIHLEFLEIHSVSDLLTVQKIDHFVFSERVRFLSQSFENYKKAPWNQKLLGIGYIENYGTDDVNVKLIEMDYYDIILRHGIIGGVIYFIPFLWILILTIKRIKYNFKLDYIVSILLILLLSLFSGHIMTAPSVSILVAYILIGYLEGSNSSENRVSNGQL